MNSSTLTAVHLTVMKEDPVRVIVLDRTKATAGRLVGYLFLNQPKFDLQDMNIVFFTILLHLGYSCEFLTWIIHGDIIIGVQCA